MYARASSESILHQRARRGALDNLEGKGKPLKQDPHGDSWYGHDAGQAALNRMLKTAGFKPPSVEARDEMKRARARSLAELERAVRSGNVAPGDLFDGACGAAARAAYAEYERTAKAYNNSVIADRENFGSSWPLQQLPATTFADDVSVALRGGALP